MATYQLTFRVGVADQSGVQGVGDVDIVQQFAEDSLHFLEGECHRAYGHLRRAWLVHRQVGTSITPSTQPLARSAWAKSSAPRRKRPWAVQAALERFTAIGCRFGQLHALVALALAGRLDEGQRFAGSRRSAIPCQ